MKVKSITYAGVADVYNMEVEGTHDFTVGRGVIAHNCYDELRYVCMASPIAPRVKEQTQPKEFNPLESDRSYDYSPYEWYRR